MNTENPGPLDASIQERLDNDTAFHESIASLGDSEKADAISKRRSEVANAIFAETIEKAKKEEELARNYKTRAEKAEGAVKEKEDGLSNEDLLLIMDKKVPREDVPELRKMAKLLNMDLATALNDTSVQTVLARNADIRRAAEAANTKTTRSGSSGPQDAELLNDLSKGVVPAPGSPEAEALFFARRKKK